jgi:hypothetical protein
VSKEEEELEDNEGNEVSTSQETWKGREPYLMKGWKNSPGLLVSPSKLDEVTPNATRRPDHVGRPTQVSTPPKREAYLCTGPYYEEIDVE